MEIDTTKAELDITNDKKQKAESKVSELEQKLQEYQEKEKAMQEAMDKRFEDIKLRQTTANSGNSSGELTKEEYLKNREQYDTLRLKHDLPTVF